jgi:hypothetical protein
MTGNTLRRIVVALIIIAPIITYSDCKKQPKCGCGEDVLYSFVGTSVNVYFNSTGTTFYFMIPGDPYSTYTFCNPSEMFSRLANAKSGDVLQVTGKVYYDCNYIYQNSNSSYQSLYKAYNIEATDLYQDLYGKNKPASGTPLNSAKPQN